MKQTFSFKHFWTFLNQFFFMLSPVLPRYGNLMHLIFLSSFSFSTFFGNVFNCFMMELRVKERSPSQNMNIFILINFKLKLFAWWRNFFCSMLKDFNPWNFIIPWIIPVNVRILTSISGITVSVGFIFIVGDKSELFC